MFRALCAHHQEVKIVLCTIWYHHTVGGRPVRRLRESSLNLCTGWPPTGVMYNTILTSWWWAHSAQNM